MCPLHLLHCILYKGLSHTNRGVSTFSTVPDGFPWRMHSLQEGSTWCFFHNASCNATLISKKEENKRKCIVKNEKSECKFQNQHEELTKVLFQNGLPCPYRWSDVLQSVHTLRNFVFLLESISCHQANAMNIQKIATPCCQLRRAWHFTYMLIS